MPSLFLPDFSGGLNLRDSPNELAYNETPDATNWTLDERGGLKGRRGSTKVAVSLPGTTGTTAYLFYSEALDLWFCARTSAAALKLFSAPTGMNSWTDRGAINSDTAAQAAFVDFPGNPPKVVITTDVNSGATKGTWTIDGAFTLTNVSTTVAGTSIALWQDRAVVAGYPTSDANGNPTRFFACKPKDPSDWTTVGGGWNQDVREKDAAPLTALGVAGGALVVYKKRSTYRVNDSSNGAYTMIDSASGARGSRAVVPLNGRLYSWGAEGLYECDGVGPLRDVGDKAKPLFLGSSSTFWDSPTAVPLGGVCNGNVVLAYPTAAGAAVSAMLEYDPEQGWLMRHQLATANQAAVSSFARKNDITYVASPLNDAVYQLFVGTAGVGADDGTLYGTYKYRTPWLLPNSGMLARLNLMLVQGLIGFGQTTTLDMRVYKDWDRSSFATFAIGASLVASSASDDQNAAVVRSLGHAASFAFEFVPGTAVGDVSIRGLQLVDQPQQWPNPGYPRNQRPGSSTRTPTPTPGPPYLPPPSP